MFLLSGIPQSEDVLICMTSSGDLLMALGYSLATGTGTPITYFYPAYFAVLLIHRQMRDDEACAKKYVKLFIIWIFSDLRPSGMEKTGLNTKSSCHTGSSPTCTNSTNHLLLCFAFLTNSDSLQTVLHIINTMWCISQ